MAVSVLVLPRCVLSLTDSRCFFFCTTLAMYAETKRQANHFGAKIAKNSCNCPCFCQKHVHAELLCCVHALFIRPSQVGSLWFTPGLRLVTSTRPMPSFVFFCPNKFEKNSLIVPWVMCPFEKGPLNILIDLQMLTCENMCFALVCVIKQETQVSWLRI